MKLLLTLSIACACTASANPEKADPIPVKRPTHESIQKKKSEQKKAASTVATPSEKPLIVTKKRSLIASSTLLSNYGQWTLIPKGSVINLPKHLKNKIVLKPDGTLVDWKTFLLKNSGWIHIHPVTMLEAQGKEVISAKKIKAYQSMGKMVVATCAQGPISVAPAALIEPKE